MNSWKNQLSAQIPVDLGKEINIFETQIELRKRGKLDEKIFAETRLRRGVYGQRYDNGMTVCKPEISVIKKVYSREIGRASCRERV